MALTIGIVGLPNAGKSTLFNALTKNDVLAANYPFATIEPNVGVVGVPDERLGVLGAVVLLHAAVPIAALLSRRLKRSPAALAIIAASVLAGHVLDVVWRTAPSFADAGMVVIAAACAVAGLGGAAAILAARLAEARRPAHA